MRRNGARFALISVGERGHKTLLLRLSTILRNTGGMCDPLIPPGNCWRKTAWPKFQPSLPPSHVGILSQGCSWLSIVTKVMICLMLGFFCKSSQQPASGFKTDGMRQAAMQSSILVYRIFQPRVKFRGICWTDVVDHVVHSRPLGIVVHCRPFWIFFAHNASTPLVF